MTLFLSPDVGVQMTDELTGLPLMGQLSAVAATASLLAEHGLDLRPTEEDARVAQEWAEKAASDPEFMAKPQPLAALREMSAASMVLAKTVLVEFGKAVVQNAVEVRHLVTNKLLIETENPDPRVRLRALELLGKITDVALFTERSEVMHTHQSSDELKERLRERLERLRAATKTVESLEQKPPGWVSEPAEDVPETPPPVHVPAASAAMEDVLADLGLTE